MYTTFTFVSYVWPLYNTYTALYTYVLVRGQQTHKGIFAGEGPENKVQVQWNWKKV